jgi:hypothetical protein
VKQAMSILAICVVYSVLMADDEPNATHVKQPELRSELLRRMKGTKRLDMR